MSAILPEIIVQVRCNAMLILVGSTHSGLPWSSGRQRGAVGLDRWPRTSSRRRPRRGTIVIGASYVATEEVLVFLECLVVMRPALRLYTD